MKTKYQAIASVMVTFALLVSAIAVPASTVVATTQFESTSGFPNQTTFDFNQDFTFNTPNGSGENAVSTNNSGEWVSMTNESFTECVLEASSDMVTVGESITLNWKATGFDTITVDGQAVSGSTGSRVISNLQESTTFVLEALSHSGSRCVQTVLVTCIPPEEPKKCELELHKSVNKTAAVPGDELTYTITINNTGTADCTGGGVKIEDTLDPNLTYLRHHVSSNISAGYGSKPVYSASDRTLRFNAHVLNPGETGTITWTGKVKTPTTCGDFDVKNQAKTTAKELHNFSEWVYSQRVTTQIDNDCVVPEPPVCTLVPATQTVGYGGSAVLTWTTENATAVTLTEFGSVALQGTETTASLFTNITYTLLATGPDGQVTCTAQVIVSPEPPAPTCTLLPQTQTIQTGGSATFSWTTTNADTVTLTDFGTVEEQGTATTGPLSTGGTYELVATGNGKTVSCTAQVLVEAIPAPTCDSFTANPATILAGASTTLAWQSSHASKAFINNGVGEVAVDGSIVVTPLASLTYQLTLLGVQDQVTTCSVPVTVTERPLPVCESFTASPNTLAAGGGSVTLDWVLRNATTATITPTVGAVPTTGSESVSVTESTTFTLVGSNEYGDEVSCTAPVTVASVEPPFTCSDNVSFTTSRSSITRGQSTVLTWNTTVVDTVSISGINATALSGSQTVSPSSDTTYVLTATQGTKRIDCPVTVRVSSGGGGGGGGISPRCELEISDKRIKRGESVELTWSTSGATEVTLEDDRGMVLFTTEDYLADDKREHFSRTFTVKPTRDTEYTLIAERGSRDRECSVSVKVDDQVVILETRDQAPLVAGISLSQVPYTGFEAGPFMTVFFYALLVAWSLYITYLLVVRKRLVGNTFSEEQMMVTPGEQAMAQAEAVRPDAFVTKTQTAPVKQTTLPQNLPTGAPVVGYENQPADTVVNSNPHQVNDAVVTELENRAHEQQALLSSDAIRYFVGTTSGTVERTAMLDSIITEAKKTYPLEDGWVVLNEMRMKNLCEVCQENHMTSSTQPFVPATVPEGSGSLAEAIVTGNIVAAYQMIGNRPMFALADAAADLDGVYRTRQGGNAKVSDLLMRETTQLTDEQLKNAIAALTGALDGVYTSEEEAVKMAIMKAVKAVA